MKPDFNEKLEMEKIERQDKALNSDLKGEIPPKAKSPMPAIKNTVVGISGATTKPKALVIKGFTSEQLALVKRTVANGATDDELRMFLHIAKKSGLDPFLKEMYFIKYRGGETIMMTGRDGFLSIAQKSGEFNGLQSAAIYEGDEFSVDYSNPKDIKIKHITNPFKKEAGKIVGGWARASRKDCIDTVEVVNWKDYYKTFAGKVSMWDKFGSAMIKKVAESIALKKQYGISGLVSQEEVGFENYENKDNVDGNKLFNDTFELIKKVPLESRNQTIEKAVLSEQFTSEQNEELNKLKTDDKK